MVRHLFGNPAINNSVANDTELRNQELERFLTPPNHYGNPKKCYSDIHPSKEPYGPLRPNMTAAQQAVERAVGRDFQSPECHPRCSPPNQTGFLSAFVHQTPEQLGMPYDLIKSRWMEGGFAITVPANTTYIQYLEIMGQVLTSRWFDRQTRGIHISMELYNLQTNFVANVQINIDLSPTGDIDSSIDCAAVQVEEVFGGAYHKLGSEVALTVWLLIRFCLVLSPICLKRKFGPGERPVRCEITAEVIAHMITTVIGLVGSCFRALYLAQQEEYRRFFRGGEAWPAPFMPQFAYVITLYKISNYLYAWSLLTCTLRFALYYSIVSPKLYILRLTISRASYRLVPTLVLLLTTLTAFAIFGNQLFFSSTAEWQDINNAVGKVLYLLRRPMSMQWDRMAQGKVMWPVDSDEPNPLTLIFLLGFTAAVVWGIANLYRAAIIVEYNTVIQNYLAPSQRKQPGDLTDEPWPSFDPLKNYRKRRNQFKESMSKRRLMAAKRREWRILLTEQKRKSAELKERFRQTNGKSRR